jgi:hypothetical protein
MPYRENLIDPLCVQPVYVDGVGGAELRGKELVEITYFVISRDSNREVSRTVAVKIIMPVSGFVGGAILNWIKATQERPSPEIVRTH